MTAPTLTEFLLAQIAVDEAWALAGNCECAGSDLTRLPACPDRVLAECEAKRRIVELISGTPDPHEAGSCCPECQTLYLLAFPYADHPDYDEAWRP